MSTQHYKEIDLEDHVVERLTESGYKQVDTGKYDKDLALLPGELIAFIKASQPKAYEALTAQYGDATDHQIASNVARQIARKGTLERFARTRRRPGATTQTRLLLPC